MRFDVYGKQDCGLCKSAMKKLDLFLEKHNLKGHVPIEFMDMETEHGAAEGDFYDVFEIPTVMLVKDGAVVGRWEKKPPRNEDLQQHLGGADQMSAA